MLIRQLIILFSFILFFFKAEATQLLVPMDHSQSNHLKSYGIAFWILENNLTLEWLLNYRGGSFLIPHATSIEEELIIRGVSYEILTDGQAQQIKNEIGHPEKNMEVVQLEKAPKIAVYTPKGKQPWDDAVTLVLTYAEVPYDVVYDQDVLDGKLLLYDWLHLHHEDFTGQYGRFWRSYKDTPWYNEQVSYSEEMARKNGFNKV